MFKHLQYKYKGPILVSHESPLGFGLPEGNMGSSQQGKLVNETSFIGELWLVFICLSVF